MTDENLKNIENENDEKQPRQSMAENVFEWAQGMVYTIIIFVAMFTFLFRIVGVEGVSMMPTLNHGDRLVINRLFYEPRVGDIVVMARDFTYDGFIDDPMIKRIIALGGQEVYIDYEGRVYIDGEFSAEDYILTEKIFMFGDYLYPILVPEGYAFVLGDNRNNSLDSRFEYIGLVDTRAILGNVILRFHPLDRLGAVN